jgi:class 3 adenylate cyclase
MPVIEENDGILLKVEGDSFLVIFRTAHKGLSCAVAMQHVLTRYNTGKADEDRVLLCVGLGYGRVLRIGDADVYGAEVNAASKLGEDTAKAGEVLITGSVAEAIGATEGFSFEPISEVPPGAASAFRVVYPA